MTRAERAFSDDERPTLGLTEVKTMASALLLIATFHASLWVGLAVLVVLEPHHPQAPPQVLTLSLTVSPDEPAVDHDRRSLRPAA